MASKNILDAVYLSTQIKSNNIIGIMLDADEHAEGWPRAGLVIPNADDKRLGIWIMPDNAIFGAE